MLPPRVVLLFGLGCFLLSMSECSLTDGSPDEVRNAKDFEKNAKAVLGNETYFLGEMGAAKYGRMSFEWGTAAAFAFNRYYTGPEAILPYVSVPELKRDRVAIINPLINAFKYSSEFADAMIAPFGKAQCDLLPDEVSEHMLVPLLGHALDSVAKELTQTLANLNNGTFTAWIALRGIRNACENYIDVDRILGTANKLTGPDCDKANDTASSADVRNAMKTYAQLNGFPPGSSHTCLPSFIAEYTHNSAKAILVLKNAVDKYTFLALTINGFCAQLAPGWDQSDKMHDKSAEIVDSLKSGMSVLDSVPPSTASLWTCQYSPAHVTGSLPTTSTTSGSNTSVTGENNWWPSEAQKIAGTAVDNAAPKDAKTWEDRKEHNNNTASKVALELNKEFNSTGYTFDALVYLPFNDAGMHCLPKGGSDSFYEYKHGYTNYFVKRFRTNAEDSKKTADRWNTIEGRQVKVLDSVFSAAAGDLCTRLNGAVKEFVDDGAFASLAAVRCGYKFVWYELGYRYFPAAGTTSKFVIASSSKNAYSANCGQIIFFQ